jgi:hypothetical protein
MAFGIDEVFSMLKSLISMNLLDIITHFNFQRCKQ